MATNNFIQIDSNYAEALKEVLRTKTSRLAAVLITFLIIFHWQAYEQRSQLRNLNQEYREQKILKEIKEKKQIKIEMTKSFLIEKSIEKIEIVPEKKPPKHSSISMRSK